MPDPAEIARNLTPIAEVCLLDPSELCGGIFTDQLMRAGLIEHVSGDVYRLTPLGVAVRDVLKGEYHGE